jgi:hypothetical protein
MRCITSLLKLVGKLGSVSRFIICSIFCFCAGVISVGCMLGNDGICSKADSRILLYACISARDTGGADACRGGCADAGGGNGGCCCSASNVRGDVRGDDACGAGDGDGDVRGDGGCGRCCCCGADSCGADAACRSDTGGGCCCCCCCPILPNSVLLLFLFLGSMSESFFCNKSLIFSNIKCPTSSSVHGADWFQ